MTVFNLSRKNEKRIVYAALTVAAIEIGLLIYSLLQ